MSSAESILQSPSLSVHSPHSYTFPWQVDVVHQFPQPPRPGLHVCPQGQSELFGIALHRLIIGSHTWEVHGIPSSGHTYGVPLTQPLAVHVSTPLQRLLSSQSASSSKCAHVPPGSWHTSNVQFTP